MRFDSPSDTNTFSGGALYSINAAMAAIVAKDSYLDSRNMRYSEEDGNNLAMVKIKGEDLLYPAIDNSPDNYGEPPISTNYFCLWAVSVAGHLFEIWVDETFAEMPFFRLDGKIVAKSADIPFSTTYPIQGDKNDGVGGEVFITDNNTPVHIYSIVDLFENAGYNGTTGLDDGSQTATTVYFDDYNDLNYQGNISFPADHPIFKNCLSVSNPPTGAIVIGNGAGVNAGMVVYYVRAKDASGNTTNWSEGSVAIPVPKSVANDTTHIFGQIVKSLGASEGAPTAYGVWIKFRITNLLNYTAFEIRRTRWDSSTLPYGALGVDELIYEGSIAPGEISIKSIFDTGALGTQLTVDDESLLNVVDRCKTLRYFDQALYLMNLKFADRVVDATFYASAPDVLYPVNKNIAAKGHYDAYNATYYRSYMHNERYATAIQFRDSYGSRPFLFKITGASTLYPNTGNFDNLTMPSRRDVCQTASQIGGIAFAADKDYNAQEPTFETFQMFSSGLNKKINPAVDRHQIATGLYTPLHPISETDFRNDHNYTPNLSTNDVVGTYNPQGFNLEYYSMGMRMAGFETRPSWAVAATVMQRKANRVAAQGIGMYSLHPKIGAGKASKDLDTLWFYSPDFDNGIFDPEDVMNNPLNYEVQIVSAVGFHEEVYSGFTNSPDTNIDLILYARILFEDGTINLGDAISTVGEAGSGWVSHRKYRNVSNTATVWAGADKGNHIFSILSMQRKLTTPTSPNIRSSYFELRLSESVYQAADTGAYADSLFDDSDVRRFHEPFYIVNILRKGASVDTSTQQESYFPTPAYWKFYSVVARQGDYGTTQAAAVGYTVSGIDRYRYELIDERWEDCCTQNSSQFKFVYIQDLKGREKPWLNVTYFTNANILTVSTALISTGSYQGALSDNVRIYGLYEHEFQGDIPSTGSQANTYYLDFNYFAPGGVIGNYPGSLLAHPEFYLPTTGFLIIVRDNKKYPIDVFGGECYNAENVFAPIDGQDTTFGATATSGDQQFYLKIGMPYYNMQPQLFYSGMSGAGVNLDYIRQMLVMFCCTSRINVNWSFNGSANATSLFAYPKIHYIIRPPLWDASLNCTDNNIDQQYQTDYPDLFDANGLPIDWQNGGFRFYQGNLATNLQYSQQNKNAIGITAPTVNFTETTYFETGIIKSAQRQIGVQDSPNLKAFSINSFRAINDKTGGIMKAYSALSGDGNNLYAFTESGICLLLTDKFVIQGAAGEPLAVVQGQGSTSIIQETWLDEDIGLPDEFWRSFAEFGNSAFFINRLSAYRFENNKASDIGKHYYHARIYRDMIRLVKPEYFDHMTAVYNKHHDEYWVYWRQQTIKLSSDSDYHLTPDVTVNPHTIFIPGVLSVYDSLMYEIVGGASKILYLPKSETGILSVVIRNTFTAPTTNITVKNGNTLASVTSGTVATGQSKSFTRATVSAAWVATALSGDARDYLQQFLFVFKSTDKPMWVGRFDYDHDRFVSVDNAMYGMKNTKTYILGETGYEINDELLISELLGCVVGDSFGASKDFWYSRINSNITPSKEEFFETLNQERLGTPETYIDLFNNRGGFESYIPRKTTIPNGVIFTGDLMQASVLLYKIIESSENDFNIISVQTWYQLLK